MFCLSKLFLASSHLCFLALSLTPSKSVWQSFLSLFPGMAPIRDSVSHSPNQTGDYTFALFLLVFSAFYSSTHCLTLALYFVINRLDKLSLTWPWQMMHFIHVKYEIERQGEMNEWVSEKVGVREGARGDLASEHHKHHGELANTLCEERLWKWEMLWVRVTQSCATNRSGDSSVVSGDSRWRDRQKIKKVDFFYDWKDIKC